MVENKDREIQENMIKMRYLEGQANAVQKQIMSMESAIFEIETAVTSLDEMKKIKGKKETLTPLGAGVFTKSTIEKTDTVLIDIGAGVVVEKKIDEAIKMLQERKTNQEEAAKGFSNMIQNIQQQYIEAGQKVEQLRK